MRCILLLSLVARCLETIDVCTGCAFNGHPLAVWATI